MERGDAQRRRVELMAVDRHVELRIALIGILGEVTTNVSEPLPMVPPEAGLGVGAGDGVLLPLPAAALKVSEPLTSITAPFASALMAPLSAVLVPALPLIWWPFSVIQLT